MSRALITGAAGFIGSHLSERLLADGYEVTALDSFSDHYERELKEFNLAAALEDPRLKLIEGDLNDGLLGELFDGQDVVFHLAARPGVRASWEAFHDYSEANITGSREVFHAAAEAGVPVVYASSSSIYGETPSLPACETQEPQPISPYGASKVMTEVLAGAYAASFGLEAVGLRYFTVYGPRQRPDMGLSRFIEAMVDERPLPLYGDGLQRRDMTYVGDIVEGTVLAAERGRRGSVYNLASGSPFALLDILEQLSEVVGCPLDLEREGAKPGDVRDTWGDISRAAAELGYGPSMSLKAGLERQVEEAERRRPLAMTASAQPAPAA